MGKRSLEDAGLTNADPNITDVKKSKKSKKEKRQRTEDPISANGVESGVENRENLPQKGYTLIYGLDEVVQEKLKQAKNAVAKALAEDPPLKVQKDKKAKAEEEGKKSEKKKKRTEGKALTAEDVALKAQRKAEKKARGEDGPPKEESTPVLKDDGVVDEEEKLKKAQWKADKKARKAADREERSKGKKAKKDATKKEPIAEPAISEPITNGTSAEKEDKESEPPVSKPVTNGVSEIYTEDPNLTALAQAEIDKFLADNFITITDPKSTTFRPITKFTYLPVTDSSQLTPFKDFKAPTSIQAAAWPFLLAGRDVIGVAETGSGKTMAFAVPCVRSISALPKNQRNKGARAVVVSPTRELAMQSFEQITKLAKVHGLQTVCVYGGVPKHQQREDLKTADIVIATPGRLNDLINEGFADLSKAKYVVLDEADRMLDKGFEEEIRKIINTTPAISERQTLMFTATWPESVRALASTFMRTPVKITIGDNPTGDLRANTRIVQKVEVVDPRSKEFRLMQLLKTHSAGAKKNDRILVFCLYKKEATRVEQFIRGKGFNVGGIHGDLSQEQRTRSLEAFKKGNTPVLVATDVAARGLDIPDVQLVINCTFPLTVEDYVHRIGRTGRAGKDGLAITLFTEHDKAQSGALINVLKAANQEVPEELMKFGTTVKKKGHEAYGAFFKDVDSTKTATKITFD